MLLRSVLGLAVVFSHLPPVVQDAGTARAPQAAASAMPLPSHELVAKVQEFCLAQPRDCMEIAQAVSQTAIRAAAPKAQPAAKVQGQTIIPAVRAP